MFQSAHILHPGYGTEKHHSISIEAVKQVPIVGQKYIESIFFFKKWSACSALSKLSYECSAILQNVMQCSSNIPQLWMEMALMADKPELKTDYKRRLNEILEKICEHAKCKRGESS